MADRIQRLIRSLQRSAPVPAASARRQDDDSEEEIQRADFGCTNKRPRLIESAPPQHQMRPIQQSRTVNGSNTRVHSDPSPGSEGSVDDDDDIFDIEEDDDLEEIDDEEDGEEEEYADDVEEEGEEEDSGDEEEEGDDGVAEREHQVNSFAATTVMLTDMSLLDCPGCRKPLRAPIYQCGNGHVFCSTCSNNANGVCLSLSCTSRIGFTPNLAMEKIAESILAYCKNRCFGCTEIMIYHELVEHEKICPQTECLCPHPSCSFTGCAEDLYDHFDICHPSSATPFTYDTTFALTCESSDKHVFLQERHENVIFILNHDLRENNRTFNVDCIGPATLNKVFVYQLTAKKLETCLSLQAVPEVCVKWEQHPPKKNYLTVPADFLDGNIDQFAIQICIKKAHSVE